MDYLTPAEIIVLHARLIQRTGGGEGIISLSMLEAATACPQAIVRGLDLYPTLWDKAAALMESLIQNHPFVDGNKRVGLVAAGLFLERNGYILTANNTEALTFTLQVAQSILKREAMAQWLQAHSAPSGS